MSFSNLNTYTQDLIMTNFEFIGKSFLILIAFSFALFYVFIIHKNKEETPYLLVGYFRTLLYLICYIFLWLMPIFIFLLYPQVGIDKIFYFMFIFYIILIFVVGIILLFNFMYIAPMMILKLGNVNLDLERNDKIFNSLFGKQLKKNNQYITKIFKNGKNKAYWNK